MVAAWNYEWQGSDGWSAKSNIQPPKWTKCGVRSGKLKFGRRGRSFRTGKCPTNVKGGRWLLPLHPLHGRAFDFAVGIAFLQVLAFVELNFADADGQGHFDAAILPVE